MTNDILARIFGNQLTVFLIVIAVMLAFAEIGYRLGLRLHAMNDVARKGQIGGVQAAVLGLLGLLLGFTFAMALERYDTLLITVVIVLIFDISHSRVGLIQIGQQPLDDLQQSMKAR